MSNVVKLQPERYSANELVQDLVDMREDLDGVIAVYLRKDGRMECKVSVMKYNDMCMASMIVQQVVSDMIKD